jgi:uncharacterized membrane protein
LDIDASKDLQRKYGQEIPVVEVGPYILKAPISRQELQVTLGAARDRQDDIDQIRNTPGLSRTWTKADTFSYWFSRHYMLVFNLLVLIYAGLPVLAPVLMAAGIEAPARLIYRGYGFACHQLGYRSFFLFGEQAVYPRQAAGTEGLRTFQEATGIPEGNSIEEISAARQFVGTPQLGYKLALCERDIAIYGSILLFGVLFALAGGRIPGLHWAFWILLGILPIGLDGFSQLLSQPPLSLFPYRESTPFLRALTGALFGFTTAWFGYPMVEITMRDSRQIMQDKLSRIRG